MAITSSRAFFLLFLQLLSLSSGIATVALLQFCNRLRSYMYPFIRTSICIFALEIAFETAFGIAHGQTMVDLRTQSKSVDFTLATATKPFKSGTAFPSICSVGEIFYKSDAPAGANVYGCTATNAWTLEGQGLPALSGNAGKSLSTDGINVTWNALGGDVAGPIAAATVTQIQGRSVSTAAPLSGQALIWNTGTNRWEPQAVAGGGGGGISMLSQAADLVVARTSATTLSIGAACSVSTPCNVRFGALVFSVISGATATISGGTGVAFLFMSSAGVLTIGHNLTVQCSSACSAQSAVTSFPADSIPIFTWSASAGNWDANGGTDLRAFSSAKPIQPGAGLASVDLAGKTVISADATLIGMRASVPATSAVACVTGSWAMDTSFYYVCVTSGSWRRTVLASW
jgi:hypothetical protein